MLIQFTHTTDSIGEYLERTLTFEREYTLSGDRMYQTCTCGHAPEEHGHDPQYPSSTKCSQKGCDCLAYEPDEESEADEDS